MPRDRRSYRVTKSTATPRRRSVRLIETGSKKAAKTIQNQQTPPPSSSDFRKEIQYRKRKRLGSEAETHEETTPKRSRVTDHSTQTEYLAHGLIAYWVFNNNQWPESYSQEGKAMAPPSTSTPKSTSQDSSNKRKSESTHRTDYVERMAERGIFMKSSTQIQQSSKELCRSYLQGNLKPTRWPCFPPEKISEVLERIDGLSESRIQRDVMPWVTPSAENLFFSGELEADWIGDDVQADWARCQTLGGTRPKPDYTAGLLRKAFTREEVRKLQIYSAPSRPFLFTAELSYPFLICEAKSGDVGLNKAQRQNIHSASIAVNAVIELHKAAFAENDPGRVDELYGKILVFTISHNHDIVYIYGHYAALAEDSNNIEFYRHQIVSYSLTVEEGRDRYKPYNFVRNVYEKFAPKHRRRIKEAAAQLKLPEERTGLSYNTSSLVLNEGDPQTNSQDTLSQSDSAFLLPGTPTSASRNSQLNMIISQLDQQRQTNDKLQETNNELLRHLKEMQLQREQERKDAKQERERDRKLLLSALKR